MRPGPLQDVRQATVRRLVLVWAACLALLLNAWAPHLSRAAAYWRGDIASLLAVCGTPGLGAWSSLPSSLSSSLPSARSDDRRAASVGTDAAANPTTLTGVADDPSAPGRPAAPSTAHCPFCLPHAGTVALLPSDPPALAPWAPPAAVHPRPPASITTRASAPDWPPGQPRAPPLAA